MDELLNRLVDKAGDFLAKRPGFLPLLGLGLILLNFVLPLIADTGSWIVERDVFLHVGLVIGFLGFLLIRPLS